MGFAKGMERNLDSGDQASAGLTAFFLIVSINQLVNVNWPN